MADSLLRPANPITPVVDDLALLGQRLTGDDRRLALVASADILKLYGVLRAALPFIEAAAMSGNPDAVRLYRRAMAALMRTEAKVG